MSEPGWLAAATAPSATPSPRIPLSCPFRRSPQAIAWIVGACPKQKSGSGCPRRSVALPVQGPRFAELRLVHEHRETPPWGHSAQRAWPTLGLRRLEVLTDAGCHRRPCSTSAEALDDPQARHRGAVVGGRFTPVLGRRPSGGVTSAGAWGRRIHRCSVLRCAASRTDAVFDVRLRLMTASSGPTSGERSVRWPSLRPADLGKGSASELGRRPAVRPPRRRPGAALLRGFSASAMSIAARLGRTVTEN